MRPYGGPASDSTSCCCHCKGRDPNLKLSNGDELLCTICMKRNTECDNRRYGNNVVAGVLPPVPGNHMSIADPCLTTRTSTAPPADTDHTRNLRDNEELIVQAVIEGNASQPNKSANTGRINVFDTILVDDTVSFHTGFVDNLPAIYEYNKKDITDFLTSGNNQISRTSIAACSVPTYFREMS